MFECVKREDRAKKFACKAIRKERVQRHAHKAKRNIKRVDTGVRALKRFSHAAVVRLYDVIQSPQHVYLVLERGDRDLYAFLDDYKDGCTKASGAERHEDCGAGLAPLPRAGYCS